MDVIHKTLYFVIKETKEGVLRNFMNDNISKSFVKQFFNDQGYSFRYANLYDFQYSLFTFVTILTGEKSNFIVNHLPTLHFNIQSIYFYLEHLDGIKTSSKYSISNIVSQRLINYSVCLNTILKNYSNRNTIDLGIQSYTKAFEGFIPILHSFMENNFKIEILDSSNKYLREIRLFMNSSSINDCGLNESFKRVQYNQIFESAIIESVVD